MSVIESVENSIIFGPVNSRRFGMSLGIDLSPSFKQCNFDCLYCELAPSATVDRQEKSIPVESIIKALKPHLHEKIDSITLTANGEPTLYPYLNELIDAIDTIKGKTTTLILTNSATLVDEDIFETLLKLDSVKLSLDAISPDIFKKIDRPHKSIEIGKIVEKLKEFTQCYKGKLYIEILFVQALNDTQEEVAKLNTFLKDIKVTRVDIGTIDRPPAYPVNGVSYEKLHQIAQQFDKHIPIHIASRSKTAPNQNYYTKEEILNTLDKRPLTMEDMALLFDAKSQENLQNLLQEEEIVTKKMGNLEFYIPHTNFTRKRKH